jgi:hypothetical protein
MRHGQWLVIAMGALVAAGCGGHAVVNKLANKNFADLMGLTRALVGNNAAAGQLVAALTAACLLGAVACVLKGAVTTVRGDRGGIETMLGGAYGLAVIVMTFGVVL